MNNKKKIFAALIAALSANAAAQGIPTFDVTNSINMISTLQNDVTKIAALQAQVASMNQQITNTTGTRGMGARAALGAVRNLPASWDAVLQQVKNTTGNYGAAVAGINARNAVLTPDQIARMTPVQIDLLTRQRNLGAMQKTMADTTIDVAGGQLSEIQDLTAQIDAANDPKAVADLTAALNAKKLELDNTRIRLSAMDQQIQAEQKFIAQRQHEDALQMLDTSQPSRARFQ